MLIAVGLLFALFLLMGLPVAFALALASIPAFILSDTMPATVAVQKMAVATQSFPLLAVPFFILAGNLMNATGITDRLVRFSRLLTGWMVGGLAQISVILSLLMGGISGSAVADASMQARLFGETMKARGYDVGFSAAVIAYSSIITATVPPSIGLILFGFINEVSIGRLLLGGILPGLLMTAILMGVTTLMARHRGYQPELERLPERAEVWASLKESIWALIFPVILVIGFRAGIFTATEAGAFVVVYALAIGLLIYRELTWERMVEAVNSTIDDLGMVMMIIIMAAVLGYAITLERAPQQITEALTSLTSEPYMVLLIVVTILVVAGMFLEAAANILLITPIVMPILVHQGFDPVHVGVLIVTVINFGGVTPPIGVIMFTVCGILGCRVGRFTRAALPYTLAMLALFLVMALVPELVLAVPKALMIR